MVGRTRMFCLALQCRVRQFEKVTNFVLGQVFSCLTLEIVQYMFTLICMQYLCISVIHWTMSGTTVSLRCLHDLLTRVYTHVLFCLYLFCKTEWLPFLIVKSICTGPCLLGALSALQSSSLATKDTLKYKSHIHTHLHPHPHTPVVLYWGQEELIALKHREQILYWILASTGSQCRVCKYGVIGKF